jgi:4-alpha-glucanotransferase
VRIFGDIPIYVHKESVDVWRYPELFKLGGDKRPYVVSGAPPDYFSKTGQLWGNPVYNWDALRSTGYDWWVRRVAHNLKMCDFLRVDHFRGFVAYWEVPCHETTATNGHWVHAPVDDFLHVLRQRFSPLPIVAEDLGDITTDVRDVMARFGLPGMKILLFSITGSRGDNPYLPHNHVENCVAYTGTHDNNTARGWFEKEAKAKGRKELFRYLGRKVKAADVHREFVHMAMTSIARTAIIPMQDVLGLGQESRMNNPAKIFDNWKWRMEPGQFSAAVRKWLRGMAEETGRVERK